MFFKKCGRMNEEQLQLFNPTEFLAMDGMWSIELDIDDNELNYIDQAAATEGVTRNEFINNAVKKYASNLTCPTCKKYRISGDACSHCGELDQ